MSLFLVGGGYDDSLVEAYDKFVSQARHHNADAPIAVVVAGPPSESADHAAELTRIVASRWVDANILTIYLDGPGTAPMMGAPATPLWAEDESFQLPDNLDALAGIIVGGGAVPSYINGLAPAAEQLSMLVRGGAPWLGFSAGAMAPCVTALAGGWKLQERQVGQQTGAEGFDEVTFVEGLGLVSLIGGHAGRSVIARLAGGTRNAGVRTVFRGGRGVLLCRLGLLTTAEHGGLAVVLLPVVPEEQ